MKKRLLFLVASIFMICMGATAQNVVYDQTNENGVRTVICSGVNTGVSNGIDAYVALAGFQLKSTVRYAIAVSIGSGAQTDIPTNSKMVITLANGKVLELTAVAGGSGILQTIDVQLSDVYATYRRFAYYNIKEKDLKKMQKSTVQQLEIQLSPADYSVGFNNNNLGASLTSSYMTLENLFKGK